MKEREARGVKRSRQKFAARLLLGVLVAAGLIWAASLLDAPVRQWQLATRKPPLREFAAACSRYGDWPPLAGATVAGILLARMLRARRAMLVLSSVLAASILAGAIVNPLRMATGRARPTTKTEPGWYGPHRDGKWIAGQHGYSSFPSAHTTVAAAMATPLFIAGWGAGLAGWIVAALIGWSRLQLGVHHPSDVVAGAILGATCGLIILRSASLRWWFWCAASAACGLRRRWPRAKCRERLLRGKNEA